MKKKLFRSVAVVLALIICISLAGGAAPASAASKTSKKVEAIETPKALTATQIYEKCSPAVVEIKVTDSCGAVYIGSGFFVGKYNVLTNAHVIANASKIQVFALDGTEYTLKSIYGLRDDYDLALLRVAEKNKNYLKIAETNGKTGETVYVIGNPVGVTGSFMRGMVSNEKRILDSQSYVQLDIPSGKGIGGGPALNEQGEVIGVMCLTVPSGNCINLAIRIETINKFISNLKKKDRISLKDYYEQNKNGLVEANGINLVEKESYKNTAAVFDGVLEELDPVALYDEAVKGIAQVQCYSWFGNIPVATSGGTGFFVKYDTVITNVHIVEYSNAKSVTVYDHAGNAYEVTDIILGDAKYDVAVLKVQLYKAAEGGEDFTPTMLHLNSDYIPAPGEEVYAIGNPQSYYFSMSKGMVSTPTAQIDGVDYTIHFAATSPGSSGGVLLNRYGEVIAITNMMVLVCENMSCSVQIKYAVDLLKKIDQQ